MWARRIVGARVSFAPSLRRLNSHSRCDLVEWKIVARHAEIGVCLFVHDEGRLTLGRYAAAVRDATTPHVASGRPRGGSPRPAASAVCWVAHFSSGQPFCSAQREPLKDALARCDDGRQVRLVKVVGEAVLLAHVVWGDGDDDVDVTSRLRDKFDAEVRLEALERRPTLERLVEALAAPQKADDLTDVNERAVHADRRQIDAIGGDPEPVSVPVVCGVGKLATVNPDAKPRDLQVVL